ncbi:MAG: phosphomannomutase/phosphoglucomutase [Pyrinomonadaceae bacterium]|nr:phosphomannomutase/phosphoglucomutase [Pyrinomonadaceae bacterium]
MNQNIFREYDIRGIVDKDLTDDTVLIIAKAVGTYFKQNGAGKKVAIGRDARESSEPFRDAFVKGLHAVGCDVLDVGMVPTPVLYYSVFTVKDVDAGVMITGSHNPADYNGFKLLLGKDSLHGSQIQEIKDIALEGEFTGTTDENTAEILDILPEYMEYIENNIKLGERKLKVVVDSGNGIGGIAGVPLYKKMGFDVVELFTEPDANFPNHHPDPTVEKNLQDAIKAVKETGADLAIAFDGDADRIGVVDEKGTIIWGDELMVIYARSILKKMPGATIIGEVKSTQRLYDDIEKNGGKGIMWKAGHSVIKAKMKETKAAFAGEMSGHIFFADRWFGFDDAIYSGARLLEILTNDDKPLSSYLQDLPQVVSTPEIRAEVSDEKKFEIVAKLTEAFKQTNEVIDIDGARILFEKGWGLVRASNTQPVLVLRFEAQDEASLKEIQTTVENKVKELS